jgi:hypothetical protein
MQAGGQINKESRQGANAGKRGLDIYGGVTQDFSEKMRCNF